MTGESGGQLRAWGLLDVLGGRRSFGSRRALIASPGLQRFREQ